MERNASCARSRLCFSITRGSHNQRIRGSGSRKGFLGRSGTFRQYHIVQASVMLKHNLRRWRNFMRDIRIAAAQFEARDADKEYNFSRIEALARQAVAAGAQIVSFHECCITGYTFLQELTASRWRRWPSRCPTGRARSGCRPCRAARRGPHGRPDRARRRRSCATLTSPSLRKGSSPNSASCTNSSART